MAIPIYLMVPELILDEVDRMVGREGRDEFFVAALQEELVRDRQRTLIPRFAGIFKDSDIPGWETPEQTYRWVRDLRDSAEARTRENLAGS